MRVGLPRRLTAAWFATLLVPAVVVVATVATLDEPTESTALGPVQPITPVQTSPNLDQGREADLSRRGEAVAALEEGYSSAGRGAHIGLDNVTIEAPFAADHVGVSGDGCVAAYVVRGPDAPIAAFPNLPPAGLTDVATVDRCNPSNGRLLGRFKTGEGPFGQPVLDFDGSTVVVPVISAIYRFDVAGDTVTPTLLPITGALDGFGPVVDDAQWPYWYGGNSVDVSANGAVVVATLTEYCDVCDIPVTVVVGWAAGASSVQVLSTPDGAPGGFAIGPSVSGDGSFVSFVSSSRLAGEAEPRPRVYVRPRSTPTFTRVSPADEIAQFSSISEDGSQVAFVRTMERCDGTVPTPGCVDDPDDVVTVVWSSVPGLTGPLQSEDVNRSAAGINSDHRAPVLSGNGRYVAWETQGGATLLGDSDFPDNYHVVMRQRDVGLSVGSIAFGARPAGTSTTRTTTVSNTGRSSILIGEIVTTAAPFVVTGGSCAVPSWLPPGATCTVDVRFDASGAGSTNAELIVREVGFQAVSASGRLTGSSTVTIPEPEPEPTVILSASPNPLDFGPVAIGVPTAVLEVTVGNGGTAAAPIQLFVTGAHAGDFEIVSDSCRTVALAPGGTCLVRLRMVATGGGDRLGTLDVISGSAAVAVGLRGQGRLAPQVIASPATVNERGFTTLVGQGFVPGESVNVAVLPTSIVVPAVADATGTFQVPLAAFGQLPLGTYELFVAARPGFYEEARSPMLVILGTYQPQGPTSAAFGDNRLVARGH